MSTERRTICLAVLAGLVALGWQVPDEADRSLLSSSEPLVGERLETVLAFTRDALTGKSFFTYGGFGGGTITVGEGPRTRSAHFGDSVNEWPGLPARRCDGTRMDGELMLRWKQVEGSWEVTPIAWTDDRVMDNLFQLWRAPAEQVRDAGFRELEGMSLRGLRFPYQPPDQARFQASWQTAWFDVRTGLPVRMEIEIEAPEEMAYGYYLAYAPGWDAGPPEALERPDCIDWGPRR